MPFDPFFFFFPKNAYAQEEKHPFTAELYGGIYINNENAWQVEPAVSWNFHNYRTFRNKDLNWLYWSARTSIKLSADRFVFGAGYNISNLDYYSGRRNVTLANGQKFYVPKKELSQSIFISIGYTL